MASAQQEQAVAASCNPGYVADVTFLVAHRLPLPWLNEPLFSGLPYVAPGLVLLVDLGGGAAAGFMISKNPMGAAGVDYSSWAPVGILVATAVIVIANHVDRMELLRALRLAKATARERAGAGAGPDPSSG